MKLLVHYLKIVAKGQLRYRSTFWLNISGQIFIPLSVLAGVVLLFARFGDLKGWTANEALLCYGVAHCAFALAELFARGFDSFAGVLSNGEFDRILVRPRSPIVQVLGARLELTRFGRLAVGFAVLGWAIAGLSAGGASSGVEWTALKALALCLMVLGGALLFSGIFILGAAFAFVTTDGLEVVNVFTDGGREMAQYPISIYERPMRLFFTFVIPFACVNYLPLMYVLDKGGSPFASFLPLVGALFVLPCLAVWKAGVRRYVSTGS
jgi:ABC-2 type transport system permease protein